jgi:hypothetical protein
LNVRIKNEKIESKLELESVNYGGGKLILTSFDKDSVAIFDGLLEIAISESKVVRSELAVEEKDRTIIFKDVMVSSINKIKDPTYDGNFVEEHFPNIGTFEITCFYQKFKEWRDEIDSQN